MTDISLCFGVISGDMVHADFAVRLALAFLHADQKGFNPCISHAKSSVVAQSRNTAVDEARKAGASHLLFIDTDQVFPHDVALRLLARLAADRTALVVAGALRRRVAPFGLCFVELDGSEGKLAPTDRGTREVLKIGTGCMLLDLKVFSDLPRPYFRFGIDPDKGTIVGEDYLFCQDVRARKGKILLDCDLSHQLGHIAQHTIITTPTGSLDDAAQMFGVKS